MILDSARVLSNEGFKIVVTVLVVAVTLWAGHMLFYKDMPMKGWCFVSCR